MSHVVGLPRPTGCVWSGRSAPTSFWKTQSRAFSLWQRDEGNDDSVSIAPVLRDGWRPLDLQSEPSSELPGPPA
jgi:hypothetical protein